MLGLCDLTQIYGGEDWMLMQHETWCVSYFYNTNGAVNYQYYTEPVISFQHSESGSKVWEKNLHQGHDHICLLCETVWNNENVGCIPWSRFISHHMILCILFICIVLFLHLQYLKLQLCLVVVYVYVMWTVQVTTHIWFWCVFEGGGWCVSRVEKQWFLFLFFSEPI